MAASSRRHSCSVEGVRSLNNTLCGHLVVDSQGDEYEAARKQYASRSFAENVRPSMIVFAECDTDILSTLSLARQCAYKVVMRSGGHQYSGLSSCNSALAACIQIDLAAFNSIDVSAQSSDSRPLEISMGVGVRLHQLFEYLSSRNAFLPHGDCKQVGIGGHAQTGGQGHMHNQFGLFNHHITGFDMYLADGELVKVRHASLWQQVHGNKHGHTQQQAGNHTHRFNDMLFNSLLQRANPGSLGVITKIYAQPLHDADYSHSSVFYSCEWPFDRDILSGMLRAMQDIYADAAFADANIDYTLYVRMMKGPPYGNIIWFMANFVSMSGDSIDLSYFQSFIDAANAVHAIECKARHISPSQYTRLALVDSVFDVETYATRLQVTVLPISSDFIAVCSQQMHEFYSAEQFDGVYIYSDIVNAGGNAGSQHWQINTDVYWDEKVNARAQQLALGWMAQTWRLWLNTEMYAFGTLDLRGKAATFGNVNLTQVSSLYYGGSHEQYMAMRKVKTIIDPNDLFSNLFTLPPLSVQEDIDENATIVLFMVTMVCLVTCLLIKKLRTRSHLKTL